MVTIILHLTEDIEEEALDRVVHVFVIQEHTGNVTQIFTIYFRIRAVYLKKCYVLVSVEFVARGVANFTLSRMSFELFLMDTEEEAEITNVEALSVILVRKSCKIPCLEVVLSELDGLNSFYFCLIQKNLDFSFFHSVVLIVEEVHLLPFLFKSLYSIFIFLVPICFLFVDFFWVYEYELLSDPPIQPPINANVMNVVLIAHGLLQLFFFLV